MRFATWEHRGSVHAGVVGEDGLHRFEHEVTMLDVVRSGLPYALARGEEALRNNNAVAPSEVRLLPPLQPPTMRDFAAFEEHVAGASKAVTGESNVSQSWYEMPVFYFSNPYAVIGAHDDVAAPPGCDVLDFELELAAVIGLDGTSVAPADANSHVFGYTIYNDWSARDLQSKEMPAGLGPAKGKDFSTTLGPYLVSADEVNNYRDNDGFLNLDASVSVNGETIGHDNFRNMSWSFDSLIAQASAGTWVKAGDVIGSGTCGNGGCLAELWGLRGERTPAPLRPGDVVELTIEGIGSTRNLVVKGSRGHDVPAARRREWAANRRQTSVSA